MRNGLSVGTENRTEGSVVSAADGVGRRRVKVKQDYNVLTCQHWENSSAPEMGAWEVGMISKETWCVYSCLLHLSWWRAPRAFLSYSEKYFSSFHIFGSLWRTQSDDMVPDCLWVCQRGGSTLLSDGQSKRWWYFLDLELQAQNSSFRWFVTTRSLSEVRSSPPR